MILEKIGILDPKGKYKNPLNGAPYSNLYRHIAETGSPNINKGKPKSGWAYAKTYKDRNTFFKLLHNNQAVIVISGTGTGKTVIIPKLVSHYFDYKYPIIITIPTKKAIESTAIYAAKCLDVKYGVQVAMRTGDKNHELYPERTKLLYATDGFVSAKINGDEMLYDYFGIIIDEAHTRGTNIDILLSNVAEIAKRRPEFKIIIMSATIDPLEFTNFFKKANLKYGLYELEGVPNFPVEDIYNTKELKINEKQGKPLLEKINELLLNEKEGNILVFVTSENKGNTLKKQMTEIIDENPNQYPNIPWIGVIGSKTNTIETECCLGIIPTHQIPPGKYGKYYRRLIFATNVVEFSVTFEDGMKFVIETGLKNSVYYDYDYQCTVQETAIIANSNIKQRCGRSGRKAPGKCIRMYTRKEADSYLKFEKPQILLNDIHGEILGFLNMSRTNDFKKCNIFLDNMITPITQKAKQVIFTNLVDHNLMNMGGTINPIGKMISLINMGEISYQLKKILIAGYYFECLGSIIKLIAVLSKIRSVSDIFERVNMDGFKGNFNEKRLEEERIKYERLKPFMHSSGDHITLINIYNETLKFIDNEEKRKSYCNKYFINYSIISDIDEVYASLYGDQIEQGKFKEILPFVILLELFDMSSKQINDRLKYWKKEYAQNPHLYNINGGGSNSNDVISHQLNQKYNINTKYLSKMSSYSESIYDKNNVINYKGGSKKSLKSNKLQKSKKSLKSKKISKSLKSNKKTPDFRKHFIKKKRMNIPNLEDNSNTMKQKKIKKSKKMNINDKKQNNVKKKKQPKYFDKNRLKDLNSKLSQINLKHLNNNHKIKSVDDEVENILSAIFYGLCLNIGIQIDNDKDFYLIKNTPDFNVKMLNCFSTLNKYKTNHELIMFQSITFNKTMNKKELAVCSKLPKKILHKFNIII